MQVKRLVVGPVMTNCYIAWDENTNEGFIVDPGDAPHKIIPHIENLKIKYIFVTHGHFDHIMALCDIKEHTGAEIVVHEEDKDCLGDAYKCLLAGFMNRVSCFKPSIPDIIVHGGETFECAGKTLKIIHTPGHSRGSYCIDTGDALFTGDTLFEDDCGRCDLPGGDYDTILSSLKLLSELPGDRAVYPGHDVTTTLNRERQLNRDMLRATESRS